MPRAMPACALVLALAAIAGCQSRARVETIDEGRISAARTFGPMQANPLTVRGEGIPPEIGRWIGDAAAAELEQRGYRRDANPDLLGRALVAVSQQQGQWVEASAPGSLPRPVMQTYDWVEGTLVLELFDRRTGDLVWRATAREAVRPGAGQPQVAAAVRRLFAGFPSAR